MFRTCCIPKCNSQRQDVKLHRFPATKEVREVWLNSIESIYLRRMDNIVNKVFVCNKHFEKRFIKPSNRLRFGAYPTLFTDVEISTGLPCGSLNIDSGKNLTITSSAYSYVKQPHNDHMYCTTTKDISTGGDFIPDIDHQSASSHSPVDPLYEALQIESEIIIEQETDTATTAHHINSCETIPEETPHIYSKKQLIRDVKSLTPKCRLLYKEFKIARRQRDFKTRAKKAVAFSKEKSFEVLTKKLNPLARKLLWMQVKLCKKPKKARRFSMDEKFIGLAVYKQSPRSYKFLQKIFILPSKTTLKTIISGLKIDVGINSQIFDLIKVQIQNWSEQKRLCTIIFDEMALEPTANCITNKDQFVGFVHLNETSNQFAHYALVFMLRGAVHEWQQPIAYYFSEWQTKSEQLKPIIKDIVAAVAGTGLRPLALVSNPSTSFRRALNDLLENTKTEQLCAGENFDNTIHLCGNALSVVYDPSYLIKGMRNNFLSKDVFFEGKVATWQDIVDVYNADRNHGESRIMHKLTDEHVIPGKIKKSKVKNCVHVFSKTVSAALSYTAQFPWYPNGWPVSQTLKNTSEFLSFMNDLFDSVNGTTVVHNKSRSKNLCSAVTSTSKHHSFWTDAIKKLKALKFVTKETQLKSVPSINSWIVTLKSFKRIWCYLNDEENVKIMKPCYFNLDPIKDFFAQFRARNSRRNTPRLLAFKNKFKSSISFI